MIEQGFNYADSTIKEMTDFFETLAEDLEPKEEKKKSSEAAKKSKDKRSIKKRKQEDSNTSVVESSKDSSVEHKPIKKYYILHEKCSHTADKYKDLYLISLFSKLIYTKNYFVITAFGCYVKWRRNVSLYIYFW